MAVTVDATGGSLASGTGQSTVSWTHVVGTGGSTVMIVCVSGRNTGAAREISSMTVDGQSGGSRLIQKSQTEAWTDIWVFDKPNTGSVTVAVTLDAASRSIQGSSVTLFGASTEADNTATGGASSGQPSTSITPNVDNTVVVDCFASYSDNPFTVGSGQTEIFQGEQGNDQQGSSYQSVASASATTMDWTGGLSEQWAQSVVSIRSKSVGGAFIFELL